MSDYELVLCRYHLYSILLNIVVVKMGEIRVKSIIQITQEERKVSELVNFKSSNVLLELL